MTGKSRPLLSEPYTLALDKANTGFNLSKSDNFNLRIQNFLNTGFSTIYMIVSVY